MTKRKPSKLACVNAARISHDHMLARAEKGMGMTADNAGYTLGLKQTRLIMQPLFDAEKVTPELILSTCDPIIELWRGVVKERESITVKASWYKLGYTQALKDSLAMLTNAGLVNSANLRGVNHPIDARQAKDNEEYLKKLLGY